MLFDILKTIFTCFERHKLESFHFRVICCFKKTNFVQAQTALSMYATRCSLCVCFWHLAEKPGFAKAGLLNGVVLSNKQLVNLA